MFDAKLRLGNIKVRIVPKGYYPIRFLIIFVEETMIRQQN